MYSFLLGTVITFTLSKCLFIGCLSLEKDSLILFKYKIIIKKNNNNHNIFIFVHYKEIELFFFITIYFI